MGIELLRLVADSERKCFLSLSVTKPNSSFRKPVDKLPRPYGIWDGCKSCTVLVKLQKKFFTEGYCYLVLH